MFWGGPANYCRSWELLGEEQAITEGRERRQVRVLGVPGKRTEGAEWCWELGTAVRFDWNLETWKGCVLGRLDETWGGRDSYRAS